MAKVLTPESVITLKDCAALLDISEARLRVIFQTLGQGAYKDENDEWKIQVKDALKLKEAREEGTSNRGKSGDGRTAHKIFCTPEEAQALGQQGYKIEKIQYYASRKTAAERKAEAEERRAELLEALGIGE